MAKKKEKVEDVGDEIAEEVVIEIDDLPEEGESWTEEFVAAGEDVINMVKGLMHETAVRRIVVKNEARNIHLSIPLALGVPGIAAGIMMAPFYAALALIAALMVDCTITVERVAEKETSAAAE